MRGSIKTLLACGALIVAGLAPPLLGAAAPAAASAEASVGAAGPATDGCSATVGNITQESLNGQAVVIFTGQVECGSSAAQIYLHTSLYNCGSIQPTESKTFLVADCGYLTNSETITPEVSGVTYTISGTAAAGNGYYAPVFSFVIDGTASGPIYGTPVLCNNGHCANVAYAS